MNKCSDCGATQPEGTLFCSECGCFMLDKPPQTTTPLPFSQFGRLPTAPPVAGDDIRPIAGKQEIVFFIPTSRQRVKVTLTDEIRIGRGDSSSGFLPELDLTEHQGAENGVSRQHARIQLTDRGVVLIDMDSTNGTYLNNYRLSAEQPYLLNNGDEILFGDLLIHLFFNN